MANETNFLSVLKTGRCFSTVQVRLLRFWEARNDRRGGELTRVDMLLLDCEVPLNNKKSVPPNIKLRSNCELQNLDSSGENMKNMILAAARYFFLRLFDGDSCSCIVGFTYALSNIVWR